MKSHYKVEIRWSDEDGVYLAHIPELDITTHGNTQVHAAKMAEEAIELHLETLQDLDIEPPVAAADKEFKGKFPLRLGKERHEDLYIKAQKAGLSMNEYLLSIIDRDINEASEYKVGANTLRVEEGRIKTAHRASVSNNKIKSKTRGTKKQATRR